MESDGEASSKNTFTLHVVSPSAEVPNRLTFNYISPSTTVLELKRRIQDTVPSNPAPERQRLIYKGKPLVQPHTTLEAVFGSEEIQNSDSLTLHLVLPPTHPSNPQQPGGPSSVLPPPHSLRDEATLRTFRQHYQDFQGRENFVLPQPPRSASAGPGIQRASAPPHTMPDTDPNGRAESPRRDPNFNRQDQPSLNEALRRVAGNNIERPRNSNLGDLTRELTEQLQHINALNGQLNQAPGSQNPPTSNTIVREGQFPNGHFRMVINQTMATTTIPMLRNVPQGIPQVHPANAPGNAVPAPPSFPNVLSSLPQPISPSPSTVYLLSSPTGPEAILMAPGGTYTTSGLGPLGQGNGLGVPRFPLLHQMPNNPIAALRARVDQLGQNGLNQQFPQQENQPNAQNNPQLQNPQAHLQDEPRDQVQDLLQILVPLGTHLWLLIRLFGFVYLFAGGAAWSRTIILGLCALVVWLAQTGIFQPFQEAIWVPIRRHIEGIIHNDFAGGADGANRGQEGRAQGQTDPTDPQQLANRMIRERQERDTNIIMSTIRRAERSVILLLASLVPGVGERHIAARDAAEAAARQEREREEQARQEAEERTRQLNEANQENTTETVAAAGDGVD